MSTMSVNRTTSLYFIMMITLVAIAFLTVLLLEGKAGEVPRAQIYTQAVRQSPASPIEWTGLGERILIPSGMTVKPHADKHNDQVLDAWKIYTLLLEGQCVASAVFCGASDIERLYLCVDPTGRIGGLIVFGEEILTGYQGSQDYWAKKVNRPYWEVCQ